MSKLLPLSSEALSPEERKDLESMDDVLKRLRADGLQECRSTPWPEAQRQCVVDSRGVDWAERCL